MMTINRNDPSTWPDMKPIIIAHDVARNRKIAWVRNPEDSIDIRSRTN
jgi:hypothetical protein